MTYAEKLAAYSKEAAKFDADRVPAGLTTADKLPKFPYAWGETRGPVSTGGQEIES